MTNRLMILAATALVAGLPASAAAATPAAGPGIVGQLIFFIPLILIFYFLLIRPQQQARKKHASMIDAIKRGDTVVTSGGLIAKVTKVNEQELTLELSEGMRVRAVRSMIADVREKSAPVAAND